MKLFNKNYKEKTSNHVKDHLHILVCMEHYNPLGIIRSLGEAGIRPIAIIIRREKQFVGSSKYLSKVIYAEDIDEALDILRNSYGNCDKKPFVYLSDDYFLQRIDETYDEYKDRFIITNAGEKGRISYYMNKHNINEIARECGMNIPASEVVKRGSLPSSLRYPVITKAIASTSGAWKDDVYICNSEEELVDAYGKIKGETILLQEFVDRKGEFNIDGVSVNHGNSVFLSMITEYVHLIPGRFSNYMRVKNANDDALNNKLKEIIKRIGYEGIFDGEFMLGKDGEIYFLEVNFRPNAFNYASTCAGMNDPYIWAKGMLDGYIDEKENYKRIPRNFYAMVENNDFKDRVVTGDTNILKWLYEFARCNCHYFFNNSDMKPFIRCFIFRKKQRG